MLLLDEPVAGVPEGERQEIFETIDALPADVSVLLIEHDMDLVFNFAKTVTVLVNGAVFAEGDVQAIVARSARQGGLPRRGATSGDAWLSCCASTASASGYGEAVVVQGVDFALEAGQSLALLGRNGTGKTTLLNTLVGVTRRHARHASRSAGRDITALPPHARAAAGIGWVPQERNIFKSLTVDENLTAVARPGPWTPARAYEMFPRLARAQGATSATSSRAASSRCSRWRARWCSTRSCCCSTSRSKGWRRSSSRSCCARSRGVVRDEGMSAIIVEQNPRLILPITARRVVLDRGAIVHDGAERRAARRSRAARPLAGGGASA